MRHPVWLYILALILAGHLGCLLPVRPKPQPVASSVPEQAPPNSSPVPTDAADSSPVSRLTINDDTVEAHELWRDLRDELSDKAKTLTPAGYRAYVEQRAARLITDEITERLLYQRASLRLSPDINGRIDTHVDAEIRRTVTSDYNGSQRRYERYLESHGRKLDDLRETLRREMIITSYLEQELKPKVAEPTRTELLAAFQASADSLNRPMRRRMSLVEVRVLDRLPEDVNNPTREQFERARSEALSRIRAIQAELKSGNAFVDLARRHSDGLHADEGGAWGWVTRGSVRERFEPAVEALYGLNVGKVSDIVETDDAFFLVRCDEIDPGITFDFEAAQPQLTERLFRAAYNRRIVELVAELRSQARIEPADLARFHAVVVEAAPVAPTSVGPVSNRFPTAPRHAPDPRTTP